MWYVIGVVVLLALYFRFKLSFDQYKEASNVVTAAYTFGKLPREAQEAVRDRTRQILSKSGWRGEFSQLEENEPALYGWYALAMAELGISPNGVLDTWNYVRNPFNVDPKSKQYAIALKQFKKKTGGEIYIDPVNHRLNGSTSVLAKRKFAKAEADAEELGKAIAPFIDVIGQFALPELKGNVKSWSLSNRTLINYLGYVAGVIDAEYQSGLGKSSTDDWTATEIVFRQIVEAQLDWIPKVTVITQNVDNLHQDAGSCDVLELHGSLFRLTAFVDKDIVYSDEQPPVICHLCKGYAVWEQCDHFADRSDLEELKLATGRVPRCPGCGALLRPDIVWFGEMLDPCVLEGAVDAADSCDVLICVGSSLEVEPAASLPYRALRRGAVVVEINPVPTALSATADASLIGTAGDILPRFLRQVWGIEIG